MGKFKVKGALQESADDIEVVIEASSYKEAERAANKMGILVSDVLVVEETKAETREKNPNTEEEFERRKFVKIALICVPILVLVAVILTLIDTSPEGRHDWGSNDPEYDSWVESEDVRATKDSTAVENDQRTLESYSRPFNDIQRYVYVTSRIRGLRISAHGIPDTIEYDDNYFTEGTLTTTTKFSSDQPALTKKNIRADPGTVIVQLDISARSKASIVNLLSVVPRDASVALIDGTGQRYVPIGYIIGEDIIGGRRIQLSLTPSDPIHTVSELPIYISPRVNESVTLLFQVAEGKWLKEFRVGDLTVGTCSIQAITIELLGAWREYIGTTSMWVDWKISKVSSGYEMAMSAYDGTGRTFELLSGDHIRGTKFTPVGFMEGTYWILNSEGNLEGWDAEGKADELVPK